MKYRLYSFVANHFLSPLQCGLQTAHVVSEMTLNYYPAFDRWASNSKTIIICGAGNHAGVLNCYEELNKFRYSGDKDMNDLPIAIFKEDIDSMNGMATACGIIVPEFLYDAKQPDYDNGVFYWESKNTKNTIILTEKQTEFCKYLKSFRLA